MGQDGFRLVTVQGKNKEQPQNSLVKRTSVRVSRSYKHQVTQMHTLQILS